jgi:uncharacterized RDD family membrane protein YckC
MKCPKCSYLGFETTERCRHCGYDFSLSVNVAPSNELSLRPAAAPEAPLADFDLSSLNTTVATPPMSLDLDRLIGQAEPEIERAPQSRPPRSAAAVATPPEGEVAQRFTTLDAPAAPPLPLDTVRADESAIDDSSPFATPRPARAPLAVRRATPEVTRRRTPRTIRREDESLALDLEPDAVAPAEDARAAMYTALGSDTAGFGSRLVSAVVDFVLLLGINTAVLYLTLAIAGLSFADVRIVPLIPMAAFLLLLNGGYLIAFTAASGQTIGKMLAHIRVIGDDGGRVDVAGAVLRAIGVGVSVVTLGLPYLVVLFSANGRALHDRLAGTRVVKSA